MSHITCGPSETSNVGSPVCGVHSEESKPHDQSLRWELGGVHSAGSITCSLVPREPRQERQDVPTVLLLKRFQMAEALIDASKLSVCMHGHGMLLLPMA